MPKDIESLKIRLKKIAQEELEYKLSKRIVFLEEPPVCSNVSWVFCRRKRDTPKLKKIVEYIEENFLCEIFKDKIGIYREAAKSIAKKNKKLEKLSDKYKVNLGEFLGIQGDFHETENQELDVMIKRLVSLRV